MSGAVAGVARAGDALGAAVDALRAAGCETPDLDAALLIADAVRVDRAALVAAPERELTPAESRLVMERVRRRVAREPVAYILGRRWFRELELAVDSRALVPRPETELLVEVAIELPEGSTVHDLGTGSGAVALAVKSERPDLAVTASDASPGAVELARANAARLALDVAIADAVRGLPSGGPFDLVVANLPYVREDEWAGLEPEITRYEPRAALVAGDDGLDAIRALVEQRAGGHAARARARPATRQQRCARCSPRPRRDRTSPGRERVTTGSAP